MAASYTQIANRGLTKLGSARIVSFDDDNKQARAVKSCFEDLRDDELRAHRWSFSIKRTALAADAEGPAFGYTYQYTLPADFLKLDMVDDRFPSIMMDNYVGTEILDYVLEGNKILTNLASPLRVRYIAIIEDATKWDINFREALACRLAAELAEDLTQSNQKRQLAWQEYDRAIGIALRSNAIERTPIMPSDNQWIVGRI